MTVRELLARMSSDELTEWRQFFRWRDAQRTYQADFDAKVSAADAWVRGG